jgi:hypothetical protein
MINYTPQNQLSLSLFKTPFDKKLNPENRWVKLADIIPWDELANIYSRSLQSDCGRLSVDIRIVIAALVIKHKLKLDDRGTVDMIQENIYLQYFCGLKEFTWERVFDPSLFVDIRKRLGGKEFDAFNKLVIEKAEQIKPHQTRIKKSAGKKDEHKDDGSPSQERRNKGTLKVDATIADQEIKFPTDVDLLNTGRENLERIIGILYNKLQDGPRPRIYPRNARKNFLNFSKKKRRSNKDIRKALKAQLQYVSRDLMTIKTFLKKPGRSDLLDKRDRELLETISKVYDQQKWMYDNKSHSCHDRIVSIFQPHVRPMVRGKARNNTEFGAKINISEVNGFTQVERFSWDAFNEGNDVKSAVENFYRTYGCYPKTFLGDKLFLTRENRRYLKELGITIIGKPLGRPPKIQESAQQKYYKKKEAAKRNHVEGKIGQGKRGYGLNNIKARLPETSESWINAIIFTMNLTKLLEITIKYSGFFMPFCKYLNFQLKRILQVENRNIYEQPYCLSISLESEKISRP